MGNGGGEGEIPAGTVRQGMTFLNINAHQVLYHFNGNVFYLSGAVKKPLKRTRTPIYKLDRKRLCIHSLTNHLSSAEKFICQENY